MLRKIVFLLAWLCPSYLSAFEYVAAAGLAQKVTAPAKPCGTITTLQLPIITWGGDIASILANGNDAKTQPGSIFADKGLSIALKREDKFIEQLQAYLSCESPFLRGTLAMINMAAELTDKSPDTRLRVIYQHTWSEGGDALVVKSQIKSPKDLKGKTIALQAYGPHVDYLGKILSDAGLSLKDVTIKWTRDLTGTAQSPSKALVEKDIDAVMVITPDALALTSNGTEGTGAEDSIKGARILLSTKSANRIIADVYAVREDYFKKNEATVSKLVSGLMVAEEQLAEIVKNKKSKGEAFQKTFKASAQILLDSPEAIADTEGLYRDAQYVGFAGNQRFFTDSQYPRRFEALNQEIQQTLKSLDLIKNSSKLAKAEWNYKNLAKGITQLNQAETARFDSKEVAKIVQRKDQSGSLDAGSLFSFQVLFEPNQNSFNDEAYKTDFDKVINLASTYGGAIITIEGHSDPLAYLKAKKGGDGELVLQRIRQSAKNLSLTRANAVRDAVLAYAKKKGIRLDPSQLAMLGHGIAKPASGICGDEPCAPKTKEEWLSNMRVEFRIIQVEAEESVFTPL